MKNLILSVMTLSLFFLASCTKESINSIDLPFISRVALEYENTSVSIDSTLLEKVQPLLTFSGERSASVMYSVSRHIFSEGKGQILINKYHDLFNSNQALNIESLSSGLENIPYTDLNLDNNKNTTKSLFGANKLSGQNLQVTFSPKGKENISESIYNTESLKLYDIEQYNNEGIYTAIPISKQQGYTLRWNADAKNDKGVLIFFEYSSRYDDVQKGNDTKNPDEPSKNFSHYILTKDDGSYTIQPSELNILPNGFARMSIIRGNYKIAKYPNIDYPVIFNLSDQIFSTVEIKN